MLKIQKLRIVFAALIFLILSLSARAELSTNAVDLTLNDYLKEVLEHNNSIQAQMLDAESNRRKERGERGIFEPQLEASVMREINERTNNVQQAAANSGQSFFREQNNVYDGGIEELIPIGGKVRLGATMSDLANNVNPNPLAGLFGQTNSVWTREYQTFIGVTVTQPLLKNGGTTPTLANIRLAALDSDVAFQEYRRQLMLTIYRAEGTYWNLYFAQEQIRFYDQSVSVAQEVLNDSKEKVKAGQGAELNVMEAQSALALRNTK
ncbi:MAG TPA: TolC family protein, partial [Candidatus Baltobacteraceae bacterium]|nr:TolC family protein [Candidatus Baltobacteraceae bacterium]